MVVVSVYTVTAHTVIVSVTVNVMSKRTDPVEQAKFCKGNLGQNFERKHGKEAFDDMLVIARLVSPTDSHDLSWKMNKLKARTLNVIETAIEDADRRASASKLVKGFIADCFNEYMANAHNMLPNNGLWSMNETPVPGNGVPFMRDDE